MPQAPRRVPRCGIARCRCIGTAHGPRRYFSKNKHLALPTHVYSALRAHAPRLAGPGASGRYRRARRTHLPNPAAPPPEEDYEQLGSRAEAEEDPTASEDPPSPRHRLRDRRGYWHSTMRQLGVICALTLSVIGSGFRMDWDPDLGPAAPAFLRNHPSALAEAAFVSGAIATGVLARTMRVCDRSDLICILPLGVAFNSAGKRRLIWDGRHVNANLRKRPFRMETLQREGRALFERSHYGGTVDVSSAYHHVDMAPESTPYLGFEWEGVFYCFDVLPFGLSSAPWLFTTVMSHTTRFVRASGVELLQYLDDLIFAHKTAHGSVSCARRLIASLRQFGWLIHPTKCVGVSEAAQSFTALGTLVNLATHLYSVPPTTVDRILHGITALLTGPPSVGVRTVARVKGLIVSTWVSTGVATRLRTREMDRVIESRPYTGAGRHARRAAWNAGVVLTSAAVAELRWWLDNLARINGCPIRPLPLGGTFDSVIESDASDTGIGAVVYVGGLAAAASSLVAALRALAPGRLARQHVERQAKAGLQFMAALPAHLLDASSTLRELYGIATFVAAVAHLLRGGRHRVLMDNLGCVFIMGGVVPPFAVGGKQWGEYVSGGSPNAALQQQAVQLLDLQQAHDFTLVFEWVPRDLNVRADYLSHASEMRHHSYRLREEWFAYLDGLWGPHSVDRFAAADNCQPLGAPNTGRFCSQFFHPDAEWVDAFTLPWGGENNWLFPPTHAIAEAVAHLRASGAAGTLIIPSAPWAPWWPTLCQGQRWAPDVVGAVQLGPAEEVLTISRSDLALFGHGGVIAIRFGRRCEPLAGGDPRAPGDP